MREARPQPLAVGTDQAAFLAWAQAVGLTHERGASRPMELGGHEGWVVLEGSVNLFVQARADHGWGRRRPVGQVGPERLLWPGGTLALPTGWRLLAVAQVGTELARLDGATLAHCPHLECLVAQVAAFAAAIGPPVAPRGPGDPVHPATLGAAHAGVQRRAEEAVAAAQGAGLAEARALRAERTRQVQDLDTKFSDLIEVVDRREHVGTAPHDQRAQLELALARLGKELGVSLEAAHEVGEGTGDPVSARVEAAGCRVRVITLGQRWWSRPGMALLGFVAEGRRPVALMARRGHYVLFDPADGTTTAVDRQKAEEVAPNAYALYHALPAAALSPRALAASALGWAGGELGVLAGIGVLVGLVTLLVPLVTSVVYNSVLPQSDSSLLLAVALLLIGATVTWGLLTLTENLAVVRISGKLQAHLEPALMDRVLRLQGEFFRRYSTGDLVTRVTGLETIRRKLSGAAVTSFLTLVFSVFNVVLLFVYSPVLGAVSLAVLAVTMGLLVWLNVAMVRHQHRAYDHTGEVAAELFEVLQGVAKMRVAHAERRLMTRWASLYRRQQEEYYAVGRLNAWIAAVIGALPALLALTLYAVSASVVGTKISGGDFIGLFTALGQFSAALTAMTLTLGSLATVVPLWQRLRPVLEAPLEETGQRHPGVISGRLAMRDVWFSYAPDAPPVLQGVSFVVEPGQLVAFTGPSGSGKSTLLRLLVGLEVPERGAVLYDHSDLAVLDRRALRRQCGVVMQGARPLPGEILSTILGDSGGTEEDAWAAAEGADLAEDIRRMPMGMHTIIGEGGLAFSGGQIQRMMIARALARSPKVLFFDEATSSLDEATQGRVAEHFERLEVTRIVVAHRLSTIRHADRIYVLDAGRIVQAGTFEELVATEGTFQTLVARQMV